MKIKMISLIAFLTSPALCLHSLSSASLEGTSWELISIGKHRPD